MSDDEQALIYDAYNKPIKSDPNDLISQGAMDFDAMVSNFVLHVFCVDNSGSMWCPINDGERITKMELLKKAATKYVEHHYAEQKEREGDQSRMALINFETEASIRVPLTDNEMDITSSIQELQAMGSTNMASAMRLALDMLKQHDNEWFLPRIILISDGQPDSQDRVVDVVESHANQRVTIDCIYIGKDTEYQKSYVQFMKELARITDGMFEMITSAAEFEQKFLKVAERKLLGPGKLQITNGIRNA